MTTELLIAIRSGEVLDTASGNLVEITSGVTRIAPEVYERDPDYRHYFDPEVTVAGSDATRSITRVRGIAPDDPSPALALHRRRRRSAR